MVPEVKNVAANQKVSPAPEPLAQEVPKQTEEKNDDSVIVVPPKKHAKDVQNKQDSEVLMVPEVKNVAAGQKVSPAPEPLAQEVPKQTEKKNEVSAKVGPPNKQDSEVFMVPELKVSPDPVPQAKEVPKQTEKKNEVSAIVGPPKARRIFRTPIPRKLDLMKELTQKFPRLANEIFDSIGQLISKCPFKSTKKPTKFLQGCLL